MAHWQEKSVILLFSLLFIFLLTNTTVSIQSHAEGLSNTIHVAPNGIDTLGCGSVTAPCRTIKYAINNAVSGDTILVASGTYTTPGNCVVGTAVICVFAKELTILGGYTTTDWNTADPAVNPTIIDGQNSNRPILLDGRTLSYTPIIRVEGFIVQNGYVQGASSGSNTDKFAFGGGLLAETGQFILRHLVFQNNTAQGGNSNDAVGGAGSGGGMAVKRAASGTILEDITFQDNSAYGGSGAQRGGYAIGGGLFTYQSVLQGNDLTFQGNTVIGGGSNGNGDYNGEKADAQGAGAAFHLDSNVTITNLTVIGNQAYGGNTPNGNAGGAFGGGIFAELASSVSITNADIRNNLAQGGTGINNVGASGAMGIGGGIATDNTNVQLDRVVIVNNTARGGDGSSENGSAGGGGANFGRYTGTSTVSLTNVIVADNVAEMGSGSGIFPGGGGGGIFINGADVSITHSTLVQNKLGSSVMQGNGIVIINGGQTSISHSIIANHTTPSGIIALHAQPGNTVAFNNNLLSGNDTDTGGGGVFNGIGSNFSGAPDFASPGAPDYDYHLKSNSAAINQAPGSATAVDIDNQFRPDFSPPDIGADEFAPIILTAVPGDSQLYLTWNVNTTLLSGLNHYQILVTPSSGASNPNQGTSINAGLQTSYTLTGLTNYKDYTIVVEARTNTNTTIAPSNGITTFPTDLQLYLPAILK